MAIIGRVVGGDGLSVEGEAGVGVVPIPLSYLDTDGTLSADSDAKVPSQKAVKTYVDNVTPGAGIPLTFLDSDGTLSADSDLKVATQKATKTYADTKLTGNAPIVGATKTKIAYDASGLVTSGADASTADIPDSVNKRYVSDAELVVIGNTSGVNTGDQNLSGLVPTTRTVNGHALNADVTVSKSDVGLGFVDNLQQLPLSYLDTDPTLAANSDIRVASQKATKTYADTVRSVSVASSAAPTPDADAVNQYNLTALAAAATFGAPTGTPTDGQRLLIRVKDDGNARVLAWNAIYRASSDLALPTITVVSKTLYCLFMFNAADTKWDMLATLGNF